MRTQLNLKGNDLLVYALIYGFSQTADQKFTGGLQYIADWCGATKQGVVKNLKNLMERGLIRKEEINGRLIYCTTEFNGTIQLSLTNNIDNKQINNINSNSKELELGTAEPQFNFGAVKEKKLSLYDKCVAMINDKTQDEKVRSALKRYLDMLLEMSRENGKPLYANVFKSKLKMLDAFDTSLWLQIIEQSLQRGWAGFYYHENTRDGLQTADKAMTARDYEDLRRTNENRRRNGYRTEF